MKLNSARQAWHDAHYQSRDSVMSGAIERGRIGKVDCSGYVRRKVTEVGDTGQLVTYWKWVFVPAVHESPSDCKTSTGNSAHQAMAAYVQRAVDTLPASAKAFGNWMYNPMATDDHRDAAEDAVWQEAHARIVQSGQRVTQAKWERSIFVASGVLYRYRRMHQGGQSSAPDPLVNPEAFRSALLDVYGLELPSENWGRDWQPYVQMCFDVCNDLDKVALGPVAEVVGVMLEVA
jgi:hypothetical protein